MQVWALDSPRPTTTDPAEPGTGVADLIGHPHASRTNRCRNPAGRSGHTASRQSIAMNGVAIERSRQRRGGVAVAACGQADPGCASRRAPVQIGRRGNRRCTRAAHHPPCGVVPVRQQEGPELARSLGQSVKEFRKRNPRRRRGPPRFRITSGHKACRIRGRQDLRYVVDPGSPIRRRQ